MRLLRITLRPAAAADEPFLRQLYASTRSDEVAAWGWPADQVQKFLDLQFQAQRAGYAAAYRDADHNLIFEDGTAVGRLYVWRGEKELHLVDISLLPQARGRGIGTSILRELMEECATAQKLLRLQVEATNRAQRLYLRMGLQPAGGDGVYHQMVWNPQDASSSSE